MSNLWFNVRFGVYHLQSDRDKFWKFTISVNEYHRENKESKFLQVYKFGIFK